MAIKYVTQNIANNFLNNLPHALILSMKTENLKMRFSQYRTSGVS